MVHGPTRSSWVPGPYGLPHGSVLGPLLYIIYSSEFGYLLVTHAVLGQLYDEDAPTYLHCPASNGAAAGRFMSLAMDALCWHGCRQTIYGSIHQKSNSSGWAAGISSPS